MKLFLRETVKVRKILESNSTIRVLIKKYVSFAPEHIRQILLEFFFQKFAVGRTLRDFQFSVVTELSFEPFQKAFQIEKLRVQLRIHRPLFSARFFFYFFQTLCGAS